jgi:hypothetical protein
MAIDHDWRVIWLFLDSSIICHENTRVFLLPEDIKLNSDSTMPDPQVRGVYVDTALFAPTE